MRDRRQESYDIRVKAAELAQNRQHPSHEANGDEERYAGDLYFMSFTKGLPHNPHTGLLQDEGDFTEFRQAIDEGFIDPFTDRVRHGAKYKVNANGTIVKETDEKTLNGFRQWEAPTAGVVYDLEGPDAQAVTMPPAPPLLDLAGNPNPELMFEMAEVYELAILRDVDLNDFEESPTSSRSDSIIKAIKRLNELDYRSNQTGRPRKVNVQGYLDRQTIFRGSSPGVEVGPYLSQFLLIGNTDLNGDGSVKNGKITYGVLEIDQKVPIAEPKINFMTDMDNYARVQRGIRQPRERYAKTQGRAARRFISTPRDLATYVHYDALYEAYLNACIILLGMGTPFDPGFDNLSGGGVAAGNPQTRRHASGFALYGGPHILTLVTEVATRALKAVRFQKFNNHIRLRPEALAARIELVRLYNNGKIPSEPKAWVPESLLNAIQPFQKQLGLTLEAIAELNLGTLLLPMAFPEGSPMHPAYGAGHATVAGACVTILKAFFDTSAVLVETQTKEVRFKRMDKSDKPIVFRAPTLNGAKSKDLEEDRNLSTPLTLEGELNKLAANISIGRNMAGVHYFSDYYDSIRMGEQIALGILEEQALTYSTDPFVMSVPTFDGDVVRIGRR
ncbi:MAG: vanadium-dependent haloperoxidase [Cyanobacteria bacterium SBLK]|nr:vanadium-dependent haloperoxidase [Cyanobacteria bacterium SBLK]